MALLAYPRLVDNEGDMVLIYIYEGRKKHGNEKGSRVALGVIDQANPYYIEVI